MEHVIIIAEAGVNHNGDISLAKKLIDVAATAGADYVKFQTFTAEKLVTQEAKKAEYQSANTHDNASSQYQMLKKLELALDDHYVLKEYSERKGIKFLSTGFDEESVDFLVDLDIDLIKCPSGEITNYPYLRHIALKGKAVVLSTGMASLAEIKDALDVLQAQGLPRNKITVLHCTSQYPAPYQELNLKALKTIQQAFNVKVGYSDHSLGIEVPIAAVVLGAVLIEKHFTLDKELPGPDHKASLEPDELIAMVRSIRNIEQALSGSGTKIAGPTEAANIPIVRKSIHIRKVCKAGEILTEGHLIMKRPGDGISPMKFNEVVGKRVLKDLVTDQKLMWEHLEN